MTPAQKRDIFYRAAAYIEAHPGEYKFSEPFVPKPGHCGCMWGHVGRIAGLDADSTNYDSAGIFGFHHTGGLYRFPGSNRTPQAAAAKLRAFADHHWPAPVKPVAMRFPELMRSLGAEVV